MSALYETANDLTAIRDVDAVLTAIVRRARSLLHADMTYLSLNDEAEGASYMKVTDGALTPEFRRLRLPLVLHEQNALPGLANKLAARLTRNVYTSFPGTPLPHAEYLGLPLRRAITELDRDAARAGARTRAGLDPERVEGVPTSALAQPAPRPAYSALASERGWIMPDLDEALHRWHAHSEAQEQEMLAAD